MVAEPLRVRILALSSQAFPYLLPCHFTWGDRHPGLSGHCEPPPPYPSPQPITSNPRCYVFAALLPPTSLPHQCHWVSQDCSFHTSCLPQTYPLAPGMPVQAQIDLKENWREIKKDEPHSACPHFSGDGWTFVQPCMPYLQALCWEHPCREGKKLAHVKAERETLH